MARGTRAHKRFGSRLSTEERLLVGLRDEVYEGSWNRIKTDLKDRLAGRPYVVKLATRIQDDLESIKKIAEYEREQGIDIAEYLEN